MANNQGSAASRRKASRKFKAKIESIDAAQNKAILDAGLLGFQTQNLTQSQIDNRARRAGFTAPAAETSLPGRGRPSVGGNLGRGSQVIARRGDSLSSIANKFGFNVKGVQDANPGTSSVFSGMKVNLGTQAREAPAKAFVAGSQQEFFGGNFNSLVGTPQQAQGINTGFKFDINPSSQIERFFSPRPSGVSPLSSSLPFQAQGINSDAELKFGGQSQAELFSGRRFGKTGVNIQNPSALAPSVNFNQIPSFSSQEDILKQDIPASVRPTDFSYGSFSDPSPIGNYSDRGGRGVQNLIDHMLGSPRYEYDENGNIVDYVRNDDGSIKYDTGAFETGRNLPPALSHNDVLSMAYVIGSQVASDNAKASGIDYVPGNPDENEMNKIIDAVAFYYDSPIFPGDAWRLSSRSGGSGGDSGGGGFSGGRGRRGSSATTATRRGGAGFNTGTNQLAWRIATG